MALNEIRHRNLKRKIFTAHMADVTAASSAFIPVPVRGQIVEVGSCVNAQLGTNPAAITVEINNTAVSDLAFSIAAAGAAGDTDVVRVSGLGTRFSVQPGDSLEFVSNGGPDDSVTPCTFHAVIELR